MRPAAPLAGVSLLLASLAVLAYLAAPPEAVAPERDRRGGDSAAGTDAPRPVSDPAARRLLERAAAAPASTAYTGTQYVSAWDSGAVASRVLRVSHDPDTGTTWRAAGARESHGARWHSDGPAAPSLLDAGAIGLITRLYALTPAGTARVAGREVAVVEARRSRPGGGAADDDAAPAGPVSARFWLDRETGLVLRREVYDRGGRLTRASAFVDLTVTPRAEAAGDRLPPAPQERAGWPALDDAAVARMRTAGWTCPASLPGPMPLVDARRGTPGDGGGTDTLHLSYADGIASVSVFQQPGRLDEDRLTGYRRDRVGGHQVWVRDAVPRRVVWTADGRVYTIVADAPPRTVAAAVRTLYVEEHGALGDSLDRLGRGLERVGSWFNPMD